MTKTKWEQVGVIGVDAGLCWIGDPCYILSGERPIDTGRNWKEFCEKLDNADQVRQFSYDEGHAGLGVTVSTGFGDGFYPVEIRKDKETGRIAEVRVTFI